MNPIDDVKIETHPIIPRDNRVGYVLSKTSKQGSVYMFALRSQKYTRVKKPTNIELFGS